jgi:hypothetical protein
MRDEILSFIPAVQYNNCFFELDESPVLYYEHVNKTNIKVFPEKKVIINQNYNQGISIVPDRFLAVKHQDAFNLGVTIFELLFGVTPQIHKETINNSTTDYNVDLISEKCKIVFDRYGYRFFGAQEPAEAGLFNQRETSPIDGERHLEYISHDFYDEYYPFIRVSNYLRTGISFCIEMGYYRYRCSNGLMMGRSTKMTFRCNYYKNSFQEIKEASIDQFLRYKTKFLDMANKLWKLLTIHVPTAEMRLISYDIFEKELLRKSITERKRLQVVLQDLINKYVREIGQNLNAALNVATEFSKLLTGHSVSPSYIQNLSSIWISKVIKDKFDVKNYLYEIRDLEDHILTAKQSVPEEEEFEF